MRAIVLFVFLSIRSSVTSIHVRQKIFDMKDQKFLKDAANSKFNDLLNDAFPKCKEFWMLGHSFDTMLDYAQSSDEV